MYIDVKIGDRYLQCTLIMTAVTSFSQTSPLLLLAAAKLIKLMCSVLQLQCRGASNMTTI